MNKTKILILILFALFFLSVIVVSKPVFATPPPASRIWLWLLLQHPPVASQMVRVRVEWKEGARTESVELKTKLQDVR